LKGYIDVLTRLEIGGIRLPDAFQSLKELLHRYRLEYRVQFLLLNNVLPLSIAIITLLLFKSTIWVLWYSIFLFGVSLMIAGIFGFIIPKNALFSNYFTFGDLSLAKHLLLLILGSILIIGCIIVLLLYLLISYIRKFRRNIKILPGNGVTKDQVDEQKDLNIIAQEKRKLLRFDCRKTLKLLLVVTVLLIGGIICLRIVQFQHFGMDIDNGFDSFMMKYQGAFFGVGVILISIMLILFSYMVIILFPKGRLLVYNIRKFIGKHSLKIIFLVLTVCYTPVATSCLSSFACVHRECPTGTTFPKKFNTLSISTVTGYTGNQTCVPCQFMDCAFTDKLCPGVSGYRLSSDVSLDCSSNMVFVYPAAGTIALFYLVGVPVLFFFLTRTSLRHLKLFQIEHIMDDNYPKSLIEKIKMDKKAKNGNCCNCCSTPNSTDQIELLESGKTTSPRVLTPKAVKTVVVTDESALPKSAEDEEIKPKKKSQIKEEKWIIACAISNNPIKTLYYCFHRRWRFFRIFSMVTKFLLVMTSILLSQFAKFSIPITLAIHTLTTIVLLLTRPYIVNWEDFLSTSSSALNSLNAVVPTLLIFGVNLPSFIGFIVLGLNIMLFIFGITLLFTNFFRSQRSRKKYITRIEYLKKYPDHAKEKYDFDKIQKHNDDIDDALTRSSLSKVVTFFMILGVVAFIGLACSIVGLLYGELNPPYIPGHVNVGFSSCKAASEFEFAKYSSWKQFTENCCCQVATHYDDSMYSYRYLKVELWSCLNGEVKERIREENLNGIVYSGLNIRGMCSRTFNPSFSEPICENYHYGVHGNAKEYERKYLW
jgi:MFS family permease